MKTGNRPETRSARRKRRFAWTVPVALAFVIPGAVSAHHSFAMFDDAKTVKLSGTITKFDWTNPHSWLRVRVTEGGRPVDYALEMKNPAGLLRGGVKKSTFKPGDQVVVFMHPLRSGAKGGSFMHAILADGSNVGDPEGG